MAVRFKILGSSSSGNCSLLTTPHSKILIDAGFSGKKICDMLRTSGESINDIDAVFITHEHSDHCAGLKGLSKHAHLKVFANRDTAQAIQSKLQRSINWHIFESGGTFRFNDLEVNAFKIPHDAYDPVGFLFSSGGDDLFNPRQTIGWLTDIGYAANGIADHIKKADVLVLESNYDEQLLDEDTRRPWSLKQRIRSRHGHLSNAEARDFLTGIEKPRWQQVFLAHLSKQCNEASLVEDFFGISDNASRNYRINVVDPNRVNCSQNEWTNGF